MKEDTPIIPSRFSLLYWLPLIGLSCLLVGLLLAAVSPPRNDVVPLDELAASYAMSRLFVGRPAQFATSLEAYVATYAAISTKSALPKGLVWKSEPPKLSRLSPETIAVLLSFSYRAFFDGCSAGGIANLQRNIATGWAPTPAAPDKLHH